MLDSLKITQNRGAAHERGEWDICSVNEEGGGPKAQAEAKCVKQLHNTKHWLPLLNPIYGFLFLPFQCNEFALTSECDTCLNPFYQSFMKSTVVIYSPVLTSTELSGNGNGNELKMGMFTYHARKVEGKQGAVVCPRTGTHQTTYSLLARPNMISEL
ncbi:hypothetical protein VNO77_44304 [Canavalia gladiata]|uniref:Uncharacterized protein n=1 Tax=Canavalia gladiata TaxID=3824 RepID=A0AAN9JZF8_CANGL